MIVVLTKLDWPTVAATLVAKMVLALLRLLLEQPNTVYQPSGGFRLRAESKFDDARAYRVYQANAQALQHRRRSHRRKIPLRYVYKTNAQAPRLSATPGQSPVKGASRLPCQHAVIMAQRTAANEGNCEWSRLQGQRAGATVQFD